MLCSSWVPTQVPDEEALLKARLKAEAAKQKQEERLKDRTAAQGRAPSKTAAAAAPEAVAVEVVGASESNRMPFTPITLVFKDLRWAAPGCRWQRLCIHSKGWTEIGYMHAHDCCRPEQYLKLSSPSHQPPHRYYVPNPSYKGKRAAKKAASKAQGDVEAPAAAAAAPKGIESEPELELLKGITGYAQPTVLMALMGGSGAGGAACSCWCHHVGTQCPGEPVVVLRSMLSSCQVTDIASRGQELCWCSTGMLPDCSTCVSLTHVPVPCATPPHRQDHADGCYCGPQDGGAHHRQHPGQWPAQRPEAVGTGVRLRGAERHPHPGYNREGGAAVQRAAAAAAQHHGRPGGGP